MPPPPRLHKPNLVMRWIFYKLVCRACQDESIDIQHISYTLLNIHELLFIWKNFYFQPKISKMNSKFEKKASYYFVELVETNPLMYNIKYLG